jgi:hypothetical protein
MAIPPVDPKKAFDEITRKREALIAAEKERAQKRDEAAESQQVSESAAFINEAVEAKERSEEREDWRQSQHAQKRALEEDKRKKEVEKLKLAEDEKKKGDARKKQQDLMADLHKRAIEKRSKDKVERAKSEEDQQKKAVTKSEVSQKKELDEEAMRALEHIAREEKKKKELLQADLERKREAGMEELQRAKHEAAKVLQEELRAARDEEQKRSARVHESQAFSKAQSDYKRATLTIDEWTAQKMFDIEIESRRLKDEVIRDMNIRKQRIDRDADRRRAEAEARREGVEEWVESAKAQNIVNEQKKEL